MSSPMVWFEIYSPNRDASVDFYTKLFGWTTEDMDMGPEGVYRMFKAGDTPFAGSFETTGPGFENVPPHWAVYITCDDVDASVEKAKSLGANLLHGPMDVPTVGRMALLQDPHGATFWVYKSAN